MVELNKISRSGSIDSELSSPEMGREEEADAYCFEHDKKVVDETALQRAYHQTQDALHRVDDALHRAQERANEALSNAEERVRERLENAKQGMKHFQEANKERLLAAKIKI